MSTSHGRLVAVLLLVVLLVAACAAGPNPDVASTAPVASFWLGLWHGLIVPVTFLISLFTDNVSIYEVHNSGNWYDFGFVLGLLVAFGGAGGSRVAARRRNQTLRRSDPPSNSRKRARGPQAAPTLAADVASDNAGETP